ncbi:MAG: Omp28-related outer membrane protein [Saprospiraceae bacterium]
MKNILLIPFTLVLFLGTVNAQVTFFEDFESYSDGQFIAQASSNWTTWSNAPGGPEDAPVSTEQAFSGANSLKLYSTSTGGGPDDVVLPFGDKYDVGTFTYSMYMYVVANTGAYFNFQAEEAIGTTWAFQATFTPDGVVKFTGDNGVQLPVADGTFPLGEWFKFALEIDLTGNIWEIYVNDVLHGSFANTVNAVASLDLFPIYASGTSQFYVDDVAFEYIPPVLPDLDIAMNTLDIKAGQLTGGEVLINGTLRNTGNTTITSLDINWSDGTNTYTDNLTGLNIPTLEFYQFTHSTPYSVTDGDNEITVWVSNPNAGTDQNPDNDELPATVTGYTPAPGKKVVVEEGTGTWCGWCPRGTVFMDQMYADYPDYFIPIAVHNGDPMTVAEYDDGLGLTAFPTMKIMREETFGFGVIGDIESRFFQRIVQAPPATLQSAGVFNETTRDLDIISQADFSQNVSGNHRLAVVLVEDNVTGTSSSYAQANYYAGGANGPMGGYESLPNPVPASQMVYDHVGRILVGGFQGAAGSVPASVSSGEKVTYQFATINIPANIKTEDLLAVTLLLGPNNSIRNAQSQTFQELLDNEIVSTREVFRNDYAEVFPNPSSGNASLRLTLEQPSSVSLRIFSATGAEVAFRDYGQLSGDLVFPLEASHLPAGVYQVHLTLDKHLVTKKIVIQR